MTYSTFLSLCADVTECCNFEQFCAECGGSCPPECFTADASAELATDLLQFCWSYGRDRNFPTLYHLSGLSQAAFSRSYQVPLRTIEDWLRGIHKPPVYVIDLLAFAVLFDTSPHQICPIKKLPEGLTVGGNLDLSYTRITPLPDSLLEKATKILGESLGDELHKSL